ncbi:MAG: hypothetical protein FWH04_08335 [Oscillospiraceae bacterium]|nr:hypothetical protein [Oscillospiraceae bacterium]
MREPQDIVRGIILAFIRVGLTIVVILIIAFLLAALYLGGVLHAPTTESDTDDWFISPQPSTAIIEYEELLELE